MIKPTAAALQRERVLKLALSIGVSTACKQEGMDRTSFYIWKKRYKKSGIQGLENLSRAQGRPRKAGPDVVALIKRLALLHPGRGCDWFADKASGKRLERMAKPVDISKTSVQSLLNSAKLGTRRDRWLALERLTRKSGHDALTEGQVQFLEKWNPNHRDRAHRAGRPGKVLLADTVLLGTFTGLGRVYMHNVIDASSGYVFANLVKAPTWRAAQEFVDGTVLDLLKRRKIRARKLVVGRTWAKFSNAPVQKQINLLRNNISQQVAATDAPKLCGLIQRFAQVARIEFVGRSAKKRKALKLEDVAAAFDEWRKVYNRRSFEGYPCFGRSPDEIFRRMAK